MKSVKSFFFLFLIVLHVINSAIAGPASSSPGHSRSKSKATGKSISSATTHVENSVSQDKSYAHKSESSATIHSKEKNGTLNMLMSGFSPDAVAKVLGQVITASSAVEHLEKMKNKLLSQFEKKTGEFATARGGYGGYGAYGFPSLEGALLSIAFLTFAVFLIDLIQQLLSRFRTGTAGVVPLVGRRRRSAVPEEEYDHLSSLTSSVLQSLERPPFEKM